MSDSPLPDHSYLRGVFRKPFAEQVAAWRLRMANQVGTAAWDDLWQSQHDRAFVVAGAMKADLLADLAGAVDKVISEGATLDTFRRDFRRIVAERGWHGWTGEGTARGEAWRTRVIYQTNIRTSYAAGRYAQLIEGNYAFWVYRHGGSREPRLNHLSWDGVALAPDHPFWATHFPPNGWGCSCRVFGARTAAGVRRLGGDPDKALPAGWDSTDPRTGAPPGIGRGWAYAPGAGTAREVIEVLGRKLPNIPAPLGHALAEQSADLIDAGWRDWVQGLLREGRVRGQEPMLAGSLSRELQDILTARAIAPISAEIMVAPRVIVGPKADRHETAGDALAPETWLMLPVLLRRPRAVLLDNKTGALIYLLGGDRGGPPQLAVTLDYRTRINRVEVTTNMVVSAYQTNLEALISRITGGLVTTLIGLVG